MEWTNDRVIDLVGKFRDHPELWDCNLKEYKDRNVRVAALSEIAVSFGVDKDEIERKIKNLVCHFSRELKRQREGTKTSDVYISKWFCFDSMLFLKDRNIRRGMTDALHQDQKTSEDEEIIQKNLKFEPSQPSGKRRAFKPAVQRSSQSRAATKQALAMMRDVQRRSAFRDQYIAFGEQVGLRIRDLPSAHARSIAKHLIGHILFKAEIGKFDDSDLFI